MVGCMNRKNMENEFINERFLGTIFGQAVGDALGLSTEFMSKQEVDRLYPNGIEDYSQIVQDDHRRRWQRGDWTDGLLYASMLHNKVQEFYAMYR